MSPLRTLPLLALLIPAATLSAQQLSQPPAKRAWWKASLVTLATAAAADAQSSVGRYEANPLLRGPNGRFQAKGVAIKAAITGGAMGVQWLLLRRHPDAGKFAAAANFAMAGVFAGVAIHNHGVKKTR